MELRPAASGLTSEDVALVLQRAADLDAQARQAVQQRGEEVDLFDPATVEEAALEVGLSRMAVRQALAELRSGSLATTDPRQEARLARRQAVEARLVSTPPDQAHAMIDRFLRRQLFVRRRHQAQWAVYRRRRDVFARVRRLADLNGKLQLAGVHTLTVSVVSVGLGEATGTGAPGQEAAFEATPGRESLHMVRLEAELLPGNSGARARTVSVGMATGGSVGLLGILLGGGVAVAAVAAAGSGAAAGFWLGRRLLRRRRGEVSEVLAARLDRL